MELRSNTELFDAIDAIKKELAASGQNGASASIAEGMSGLNGLTDGWAYLLEHLNSVSNEYGLQLTEQQLQKLDQVQATVHKIVYRV